MTHNQSCGKFNGPSTWHPWLCPPTPEAGQWPHENSLWQTGQLWATTRVTVWLYRQTRMKGKWPKLQFSWEGLYKVVTWINDVVWRIPWNPRPRFMVVHLDRLASYQGGTRDEWPYGGSSRSSWRVNTVKTEKLRGRWGQAQPSEMNGGMHASRPFRTNSLMEGAM